MAFGRFVEGRGDDFGVDGAGHVGHFLGTFVDEEHNHIYLGMVGGDGVGDVLHQDGLTGLGLGHDEGALAFADGGEEVYHAGRERVAVSAFAKLELFVGEERREVLEGNAVAHEGRITAVDFGYLHQREVFFSFLGRADDTVDHVACLQAEELDLRLGYIDVVGRGEVVVVRRTEESIAVGHDFQYAGAVQDVVEVVGLFAFGRLVFGLGLGVVGRIVGLDGPWLVVIGIVVVSVVAVFGNVLVAADALALLLLLGGR